MLGNQSARVCINLIHDMVDVMYCRSLPDARLIAKSARFVVAGATALLALQAVASGDSLDHAMKFNAFIEESFTAVSSDVQGRLAAGGDISLSSYGVSSVYQAEAGENVLIAGGDIGYVNGQIFSGSVLAAGSTAGIGNEVLSSMQAGTHILASSELPFSFYERFEALRDLSLELAELDPTGISEYKWGGTHLTGDCESDTQVFNIDGTELLNSTWLVLNCIPEEATLLLNILGNHTGLKNIGLAHLAPQARRTLYNFPEATTIELVGVGIEGSVLAPFTHVDNPQGSINGTVIAKSWDGPMELHHVPFTGTFNGLSEGENQAPVYVSEPVLDSLTETEYQYPVIVEDPDLRPVVVTLQKYPTGMMFDESNILHWIPTAEQLGENPVVIAATDGQATVLQEFSINVTYSNTAPALSVINNQTMNEGEELVVAIQAVDREGDVLEFNAVNLPTFATLDGNIIVIAAGFESAGVFTGVEVSASDGVYTVTESFDLEVVGVNRTPKFTSESLNEILENKLYTYKLIAQDPDKDAVLTYRLVQGPGGMLLNQENNTLEWNTSAVDIGLHELRIEVTDEFGLSDTQSFTLEVLNINDAPIAIGLGAELFEDSVVNITLQGDDQDNDFLSYSVTSQPEHGILSGVAPNLIYTPNENYFGSDEFTFFVNDGEIDSSTATISITVISVNDAPVAQSNTASTNEDAAVNIVLGVTDGDGDAVTYRVTTLPRNGVLNGAPPNLIYTPNMNYFGQDVFTFVANDGALNSLSATIQIEIEPVNDRPTAIKQSLNVENKNTLNIALTGSDVDGDLLIFNVVSIPSNGVLNGAPPDLTYQANEGFIGVDELKFTVADDFETSLPGSIFIDVGLGNRAPRIDSYPELVGVEGEEYRYSVESSDPDGGILALALVAAPRGVYLDENTNSIVWDFPIIGSYDISLSVTDSEGLSVEQLYTLQIVSGQPPLKTEGQEYWFMFNRHPLWNTNLVVYLSSKIDTVVTIESSGLNYSSTHQLVAHEITEVDLSSTYENQSHLDRGILNRGFHIVANNPITAHLMNQTPSSTDASLLHPVAVGGTSYRLMTYAKTGSIADNSLPVSGFMGIVATEDNTLVTVTSPLAITELLNKCDDTLDTVHPAGEPFQILLQQGETYHVDGCRKYQDINTAHHKLDLTGTLVESEKPISVFSGARNAYIGDVGYCCNDMIVEQVPAVTSWGSKFFTFPMATQLNGEHYRILASTDNTYVSINGDLVAHLNAGEFYSQRVMEISQIEATYPILVAQFPLSQDSGGRSFGDTAMTIVTPVEQFLNQYNVFVPVVSDDPDAGGVTTEFPENYINVIALKESASSILIDGQPVDSSLWIDVLHTLYSGAQISLDPGRHNVTGNSKFGLIAYGFDRAESYAYTGGMALSPVTGVDYFISTVDVSQPSVGDQVCISLQVFDDGNGPIAQQQIFINRTYDEYSLDKTLLSDVKGKAEYCYIGVVSGEEQVSIRIQSLAELLSIEWSEVSNADNHAPKILSMPKMFSLPSVEYKYEVKAEDPDGDILTYRLKESPEGKGMEIDSATGVITWLVDDHLDKVWVTVEVTDGELTALQRYLLRLTPGANRPPKISSRQDDVVVNVDRLFMYHLRVLDPDYEEIIVNPNSLGQRAFVYSVISGPGEISERGAYLWTPTESDVGVHTIGLQVTDNYGAADVEYFDVDVRLNSAPQINSMPDLTVVSAHDYFWNVDATDIDGDLINYRIVSAPPGMNFQDSLRSRLRWTPTYEQVGVHQIEVEVYDPFGGVTPYSFQLTVLQNQAPVISSPPVLWVFVDEGYIYIFDVSDEEADRVASEIISGPSDVRLRRFPDGVYWRPTIDDVGTHELVVEFNDGFGGITRQTYALAVIDTVLTIVGVPDAEAVMVGEVSTFVVEARHPNNLPVSFALDSTQPGLTIDSVTGEIRWAAVESQIGIHQVTVTASDGHGQTDIATFSLQVVDDLYQAPTIVSTPPKTGYVNQFYRYQIEIDNPFDLAVRYSLEQGPADMIVGEESGLVQWLPSSEESDVAVVLRVTNQYNNYSEQPFTLSSVKNSPPDYVGNEEPVAVVGYLYEMTVMAIDGDDDDLTYSLISAPPGFALDEITGKISWIPELSQAGRVSVVTEISDGKDNVTISWDIDVYASPLPIDIAVTLSPQDVVQNGTSILTVSTSGGNREISIEVLIDGESVTLDEFGMYELQSDVIGMFPIIINATDGYANSIFESQYRVFIPGPHNRELCR